MKRIARLTSQAVFLVTFVALLAALAVATVSTWLVFVLEKFNRERNVS